MLLSTKHISHEFDYPLFEDINIDLTEGETVAITGVSGCGKSTLLHICSTLLEPKSGEVFYGKLPLYKQSNANLLKIRRHKVGIIFQSHYLFKGFSAKENVLLANVLAQTTYDNALLEKLGVLNVIDQNISDLSGGQQQRISIARVLSKKPKIIFADEPTGNLDENTAQNVMNVLFEYVKSTNAALFLVTHDNLLAHQCDKVYELKNLHLNLI